MKKESLLHYPKLNIFNPLFAQTVSAYGVLTLPPLAAFIVHDQNISAFFMGLLMASFYIGAIIFSFVTGQIISALGIKHSIILSLLIIGCFVMLSAVSPTLWLMIIFLCFAGMGYSLINPAINQLISEDFRKEVRGVAMSIKQTGVTFGGVLTALSLPVLASFSSWRIALFSGGAFVALLSLYFLFALKANTKTGQAPRQNLLVKMKTVFKNSRLMRLSILSFFFVGAQFSYFMYLVLYLNMDLGYSTAAASLLLALSQAFGSIGRVFWGIISDRLNERGKILHLIGVSSAFFVILLSLSSFVHYSILVMTLITILLGFTISGWNGVFQAAIVEYGGEESAAVSSGVSLTFTYMGICIFPLIFGWSKDVFSNFAISWIILSICLFISAFLIRERKPSHDVGMDMNA